MRTAALVGVIALCACSGEGGTSEEQLGPSGGKADDVRACPDAPVAYQDPGADATAVQRLNALRTYADGLMLAKRCSLDESFAESGLHSVARLDAYALVIGPEGCLDAALEDDDHANETVLQVEATVAFLSNFHEDMNGQHSVLFDTVHVCPEEVYDADLQLDRETKRLGIGTSYSLLGFGMAPSDAEEIHDWWAGGDAIDHLESVKAWNDEMWFDGTDDLWMLLDPIGEARMSLRDEVQMQADAVATQLKPTATTPDRKALSRLIKDHVRSDTKTRNVRACALGLIESGTDAKITQLVQGWRASVLKPKAWVAIADTVIAASQPPTAIAGHSVAQRCGVHDFDEVEMPHIAVRDYLVPEISFVEEYVATQKDQVEYQDGTVSCAFEIDGSPVVVSADQGIATMALDHTLYELDVNCDAVAIEDKPDKPNDRDPDPGDPDPGDNDPGDNDPGDNDPGDNDPGDNDPGDSSEGGGSEGGGTDDSSGTSGTDDSGGSDGGTDGTEDGGTGGAAEDASSDDDDSDDDGRNPFGDDGSPFGDDGSPFGDDGSPLGGDDDDASPPLRAGKRGESNGCSVGGPSRSGGGFAALLLILGLVCRRRS